MSSRTRLLITATLLLVVLSCSSHGLVETAILQKIATCKGRRGDCEFALKDVTTFEWDELYAFRYDATRRDREEALHRPLFWYAEFQRELFFLRAGQVVWRESGRTNIEHPIADQVIFDIPDKMTYRRYDRNVRFVVHSGQAEEGTYYVLTSR